MEITNHPPTTAHSAIACPCAICRSLHHARTSLLAVPIQQLNNAPVESDTANLLIEAVRLLGTAQNFLQQYHIHERHQQAQDIDSPSSRRSRVLQLGAIGDGRPSPTTDGTMRQVTSPRERPSPQKRDSGKDFEKMVKARAAELGILKSDSGKSDPPPTPTTVITTNRTHADEVSASPQKTKFLVCDHCRSHGLRCNEASVCKECVLRELPCTHRMCELSDTKAGCPRTVCFYVHKDWMPNIYGQHDPNDENWLALPGKLREHLSSGQLTKVASRSENETLRCYQGVTERQLGAKNALLELVNSGAATWESACMACRCQEIEAEQNRTRAVEDRLRRLDISREVGRG